MRVRLTRPSIACFEGQTCDAVLGVGTCMYLAQLGIVRVESQASLQDGSAPLQVVAQAALLGTLLKLRPGHPGLDQVGAHLHALPEGLPRS